LLAGRSYSCSARYDREVETLPVDSVVGGFPNAHVTSHLHMANRERRGRQIETTGASGAVSQGEMLPRQSSFLALLLLLAAARGCRRRLGFLGCLILCLCAICSGSILHSSIFGGYSRVSWSVACPLVICPYLQPSPAAQPFVFRFCPPQRSVCLRPRSSLS
jgi:hypothetical protein